MQISVQQHKGAGESVNCIWRMEIDNDESTQIFTLYWKYICTNLASKCSTMSTSYVAANRSYHQFGVEQVENSVFFSEHR